MDRFDCQYLMASFVNVYIHSFISAPDPKFLLKQLYLLKPEEQMFIFQNLKERLQSALLVWNETNRFER